MDTVSWASVSGDWNRYKCQLKRKWNKLTEDDLMHIGGDRELLVAALQQRYALPRERVEAQVDEFVAAESGEGWTQRAKHKAASMATGVKEYFQNHQFGEIAESAADWMRRHPVPATLAGVGTGFLLGLLLRRRRV